MTAKERPILFSAPMVAALLDGRKTQTRRVIKPQPIGGDHIHKKGMDEVVGQMRDSENAWHELKCPYGKAGDHLWVRETFCEPFDGDYRYRADASSDYQWSSYDHPSNSGVRWRPSIFMPRKASRIDLEITEIRVQRLNDISEDDAKAEGLNGLTRDGKLVKCGIPDSDGLPGTDNTGWPWDEWEIDARKAYKRLWEKINGPRSWDENPWVWVINFRRVRP